MKTDSGRVITLPGSSLSKWMMTRDNGEAVRLELNRLSRHGTAEDTVVIDLSKVAAMTFSFADEFLGVFVAMRDDVNDGPGIVVTGLNEDPLETVQLVLERRGLALVHRDLSESRLLTKESHLVNTYDRALVLREFRASEMAEQLGITPQNVNNRLKKLAAVGALRRTRNIAEHGGKEFSYRVVS